MKHVAEKCNRKYGTVKVRNVIYTFTFVEHSTDAFFT